MCRTVNGADINAKNSYRRNIHSLINGGGIIDDVYSAAQKDGRGNICPVTIILPTLAMEAKESCKSDYPPDIFNRFMEILDEAIDEAKDQLIDRYNHICSQKPEAAQFMYENHTMAGFIPEEGIKSAITHGTLAVGNLGLAEALTLIFGFDHANPIGMEYAKKIYQLYKDRCNEYKEKYSLNFGVYNSPAENLSYTAMKKFQKKYGTIEGVSDKEYFTNSMHVPVYKKMDPFQKIDIESQLTGYSSAG